MDYGRAAERLMTMDDEAWMRHANPWSGLTRFAATPFFFLALWSHVWIGWWSLIPIGIMCFWAWWNPRAFPKPKSTKNWMSKGVFGERVWLNRKVVPIPEHHARAAHLLTAGSAVGAAISLYGFIVTNVWPAAFGFAMAVMFKTWFVDRMVWLYEDMKDATPEYRAWLY